MSLVNVNYPVTGSPGTYMNIFPASKRLDFTMTRIDQSISTITSGTGGRVKITTTANMFGIKIGDFVSWGSDAYTPRNSRVFNVINEKEIEVEEVFTSLVATNSFINYKRNWYLEIRYVDKGTSFGDQNSISLFDFNSQIPNSADGSIVANIAVPSDFLTAEFDLTSGVKPDLFTEYKIQYRESYEGSRDELWISPEPDVKIMLAHGTIDLPFNDFTDISQVKRFPLEYPLIYSYIYSDVNDLGVNQVTFKYTQYDLGKQPISVTDLLVVPSANGVYLLNIDTNTLDDDCVFVVFQATVIGDLGQYEPEDYDGTQYKTEGVGAEGFPYIFPLELS